MNSNRDKKILLFSNFELPESCANAKRVFLLAKMLKCGGFDVELLGVKYCDGCKVVSGEYSGLSFRMICAPELHGIKTLLRAGLLERRLKEILEEYEDSLCAVLISNVYFDFSKTLLSYSKKYNVPIVVNSVEWYDRNNELFNGPYGIIRYIQNRVALKYIHKKMNNVIAISTFLGDYYKNKGCNVCVIPTLVNMDEYSGLIRSCGDKIRIAYAGSPAKKDYICNAIRGLSQLSKEEQSRIVFHFYGATEDDFRSQGVLKHEIEAVRDSLVLHGRIPYKEVKKCIAQADYTMLLRPNSRYANAGFPTKVGESMACGTPVITNLTSDLSKYVIPGETGIVCENESPEAFAKALKIALELPKSTRIQMSKNSLITAMNYFDYRNYINIISDTIYNAK